MEQKKEADCTMTESQASMFNQLPSSNPFKGHSLKCVVNKMAVDMCLNEKCKQNNVFQCLDENCQCRENHQYCAQGKSRCVIKMVQSKIIDIESFIDVINKLIDKKIDELSTLRQTLIKIVQIEFKYIDLNVLEKKFLKLKDGDIKIEDFSSSESKKIWQSSCQLDEAKKCVYSKEIHQQLQKFDKKLTQTITKSMQDLQKNINHVIEAKKKKDLIQSPPIEIINSFQHLKPLIMKSSAICTTEQLALRLIKMFDKKMSNLTYLFCASKNQFSIKKYFEVCGSVENTVVICKTNKDKVIGAYTPLTHIDPKDSQWIFDRSAGQDNKRESFIFSLTEQQKFILINNSGAIYRSKKREYICFGNNTFMISQNQDLTSKGCSRLHNMFGSQYYCPPYSKHEKSTYLKFNGNQSEDFAIKEWQVWKVEF